MTNEPQSPSSTVTRKRKGIGMLLMRNRATLLGSTVGGIVFLLLLSLVLPQSFTATSTVLPPERQGGGGMLAMLAGASSALDLIKGSDNPTLDLFKTIVESRNVAEEVARDPKVKKYFSSEDTSTEAIAGALNGSIKSEALRTGVFTVTLETKTHWSPSQREVDSARMMSAYIANRFVDELDRFNRERLMTSAHNTRVFVEREYNNRMAQLDSDYKALQAFQESNKTISLPEQLSATVTAAAKLTGEIQSLEMELGIEERELSPNSAKIQILKSQLQAARDQLQKYDDGGAGEYIVALKNVPELSRTLAWHMREVKVLEQITAYLRQQLEEQRISEQRDLPSLQVLDSAVVPKTRSFPHRSVMSVLGAFLGLLFGFALVGVRTLRTGIKERPEDHYRIVNVMNAIRFGKRAAVITPVASTNGGSQPEISRTESRVSTGA